MLIPNLQPLPFCAHCDSIQEKDKWQTATGKPCKTTEKLLACAKCHIRRFCGTECQRKDWATHKLNCIASNKPSISARKIDKIVAEVATVYCAQAGDFALQINNDKKVLSFERTGDSEEKLVANVAIEENTIGRFEYLMCTNISSQQPPFYVNTLTPNDL